MVSRRRHIGLFKELVLETQANCTRRCRDCLRATYPNASRIAARHDPIQMPTDLIHKVIDDAAALDFRGWLCLNFFNEPLLDPRLAEIGLYAKRKGNFREVYANTNGDLFDLIDIGSMDGALDRFNVALYGPDAAKREERIRSLFHETTLTFTGGKRIVTHYSPHLNFQQTQDAVRDRPCIRQAQLLMIIAYTGAMHMCCDDIAGEWGLGNIRDHSLNELWFGAKHMAMLVKLATPEGRHSFPYCAACPRW